jgi:hypothetical protein
MSAPDSHFPLEYVTGPIQVPPYDASVTLVQAWISVLNLGAEPSYCQILGYRTSEDWMPHAGTTASQQLFDSGDAEVVPTGHRLVMWDLSGETGQFWVKVLAMSPELVPSIEWTEQKPQDDPGPFDVMLRYLPNDFALFHHRVRYVPTPVPVGPIEAV